MSLLNVYMVVLHGAAICAICRYRRLDKAMQIMCWLLWLTDITETFAYFYSLRYHNNMVVYMFFNPLELGLVALYFSRISETMRRYYVGPAVFAGSILCGLANAVWLQPPNVMNSNFLLLDGLVTICMALFFLMQLMLAHRPGDSMHRNPHFWISVSLIFFWAATFCNWGLHDYLMVADPDFGSVVGAWVLLANIIAYGSILAVLYQYPKMQPQTA